MQICMPTPAPAFQSWDKKVGSMHQTPSPPKYKRGSLGTRLVGDLINVIYAFCCFVNKCIIILKYEEIFILEYLSGSFLVECNSYKSKAKVIIVHVFECQLRSLHLKHIYMSIALRACRNLSRALSRCYTSKGDGATITSSA